MTNPIKTKKSNKMITPGGKSGHSAGSLLDPRKRTAKPGPMPKFEVTLTGGSKGKNKFKIGK